LIRGLAIAADSRSHDLGGFVEVITHSAIAAALRRQPDVRALAHHAPALVLGRVSAKTLRLRLGPGGLVAEIDEPTTSYAADLVASISRQDISGMSFGFRAVEDAWTMQAGTPLRTVLDFELAEVSPVAWPAYESTSVNVRNNPSMEVRAAMSSPPEIRPPLARAHTDPARRALLEFLRRGRPTRFRYDKRGNPEAIETATVRLSRCGRTIDELMRKTAERAKKWSR
jgi:hypothetical protein